MDISTASLDLSPTDYLTAAGAARPLDGGAIVQRHPAPLDPEQLRRCAWEIGERRPAEHYTPPASHVGLAMVHPGQGFAYWRVLHDWVEQTARAKGGDWAGSRPVLRLYDVSYIHFTGLNAHRIQDHALPGIVGEMFLGVPGPGTWQLAEVGFLLRNGEFIPAARSPVTPFPPDAPSRQGSQAALLVTAPGRVEPVGNVWEQENELRERRRPNLRHPLRIAALAFAARPAGQQGALADFVTELAAGQRAHGHEVHVFVPASEALPDDREQDGVQYHPLRGVTGATAMATARAFARAAEARLAEMPPFDLIHMHEWMTGLGSWVGHRPVVLSLGSIEAVRRGSNPADAASLEIEKLEGKIARSAGCVLTPSWLRDRAAAELGLDSGRVHPFAMEGRLPNEWEAPLDVGHVKMGFGVGPLDRLALFIGPLEHAAGVDILLEALPVLLRRWGNLRLAYVGNGPMRGQLERRAHELGVAWAVRFLGDQGGMGLTHLLRASEALVLPSRYRIAMDDAVVDLARKAGRPVVTTHGGPAHLVRHEENGLLTYDNPGSMVWAVDRVLGDPGHADRMGQNGRRSEGGTLRWIEVARQYLESCVTWFPELTVTRM
jgi:glycosyltransferase involved in cell wall biosynthesis